MARRSATVTVGALDAGRRGRPDGKALGRNRLPATRAASVTACLEPPDRRIDLGETVLRLADQRGDVLSLVGDGRTFGVVLIVGVCLACRLDHRAELSLQASQPTGRRRPLG